MTAAGAQPPIGILGGTFDPVHHGHLRLALEMLERLRLAEVRLVPLARPAHRAAPVASAEQRLAMLERAVEGVPGLRVDARELSRAGTSYTVDTLADLRREYGPERPLCLILGMDAFAGLTTWMRWTQLPELAHLALARRPGSAFPRQPELLSLLERRRVDTPRALGAAPAGAIVLESFPLLDISSSRIRELVASGGNPRYLLPEAVVAFIEQAGLYRAPHP